MERYQDMAPRVEALEALQRRTESSDVDANANILEEATELYQLCKKKYIHWSGMVFGSSFLLGFGIGAAIPTIGLSFIVSSGLMVHNSFKADAWQTLKNQCKKVAKSAADNSGGEFINRPESFTTFLRPCMKLGATKFNF